MYKKTILHLCSYYIGNRLYKNLFALLGEVFKQVVYVPVKDSSLVGVNSIADSDIEFIYDPFLKKYHKFLYGIKTKSQARRVSTKLSLGRFEGNNIGLIHAHTLFSDGGTAYLLSKKYNIPYVVNVRNTDINYFYKYALHYRFFSHQVLLNASQVVLVSHSYRALLFEALPKKIVDNIESKCIVLPNGIEEEFIQPLAERKDRNITAQLYLFTSASLDENKNIRSVIDLVALLKEIGYQVVYQVAGQGALLGELEQYAALKGLSKDVVFLGHLQRDELMAKLDESTIFVMTSFKETFGISYIEAIARGLPIIYTKNQGVDGFFWQGEVGYAIDPTDTYAMQQAVRDIVLNYDAISSRCRERAEEFVWSKICNKYIELYQEIIKNT